MNPVKTDETLFVKLHNEWISNLYAYEEQLNQINTITRQLQSTVNDMQYQRQLHQICTEIILQKNVVNILTEEVLLLRKRFNEQADKQIITLADLMENNRYRDKLRKTEQEIFMLKYQVNKLLSLAS